MSVSESFVSQDTVKRVENFIDRYPRIAIATRNAIRQKLDTPDELRYNMETLLSQLALMHNIPSCHKTYVEIVVLLSSWPTRFGFGFSWLPHINEAYHLAQEYALADMKATLLFLKSKGAFFQGHLDEALTFGLQALDNAKTNQQATIAAHSLSHIVTVQLYRNQVDRANTLVRDTEIENLVATSDDAVAQIYWRLAHLQVLRKTGMISELRTLIESTEESITQSVDSHSLAIWLHNVGLFWWYIGEHQEALKQYRTALNLLESVGDDHVKALMAETGLALWAMGQLTEAESLLIQAREIANQSFDYIAELKMISHLALVTLSRGFIEQANDLNNESLNKAYTIHYTTDVVRLIGNRGVIRIHQHDYKQAIADLEHDRKNLPKRNQHLAWTLANLGRAYKLWGHDDVASQYAHEALAIAKEKGYRSREIIALRSLAECVDDLDQSNALLREALKLSKDTQLLDEAACRLMLASKVTTPHERTELWESGCRLLAQIGADAWLNDHHIDNPPRIPLLG